MSPRSDSISLKRFELRSLSLFLSIAVFTMVVGCANPLNRATSDRYAQMCSEAYQNRLLDVAENACYRATVNVNLGNLGPELKSERWYNLALVKRDLKKFDEAEDLFKESLEIEEKLSGASSTKTGRRLAMLAAVKYQKAQYIDGFPLVERLLPISSQYSGQERMFAAALLHCYATQAERTGQLDMASRFRAASSTLGAPPSNFKCNV